MHILAGASSKQNWAKYGNHQLEWPAPLTRATSEGPRIGVWMAWIRRKCRAETKSRTSRKANESYEWRATVSVLLQWGSTLRDPKTRLPAAPVLQCFSSCTMSSAANFLIKRFWQNHAEFSSGRSSAKSIGTRCPLQDCRHWSTIVRSFFGT